MARVLLMSTMERGHTNPVVPVAQRLLRAGHTVGWLCIPQPGPQVRALGVEVLPFDPPPPPDHITGGPELADLVRNEPRLHDWIKTLLLDAVPDQIEPVRRAMAAWRPDVVAPDPMLYQGVIAAHLLGLPVACISSSLNPITPDGIDCPLSRTIASLTPQRQALFARYGVPARFALCDWLAPRVNVVFSTPAYAGTIGLLRPGVQLVGPSIPAGARGDEPAMDWSALDASRPLVYASFGSQIYHQPEIFMKIARATAPLGVQVLLVAGDLARSSWAHSLPSHVVVVPYAPQLQVLARARVFITHGGANSVMESLHAGVPLLQSPVCNDQWLQARFVQASGVGRVLDLSQASVEQAASVLGELLTESSSCRTALAPVTASYRAMDGANRAAELVVSGV